MLDCTFGEWLRLVRKEQKLSRPALGLKLGFTAQSIALWENGQKQPSKEAAMAVGLVFNAPEVAVVLAGYVPDNFQRRFTTWVLRKYQPRLHKHFLKPGEDSLHSVLEESSVPQLTDSKDSSESSLVPQAPVSLSLGELFLQP